MKKSWTDEMLIEAVKKSTSIAGVLRELGLTDAGSNHPYIRNEIRRLNLSTYHFTGQSWRRGERGNRRQTENLETILVKDRYYASDRLKKRLIKEGVFDWMCYGCFNVEWCGEKIPLELEHKNGDKLDNRLENLTLLCCNCHALTKTYKRSKNDRQR